MKTSNLIPVLGWLVLFFLTTPAPVQAQPREQAAVVVLFIDRATQGEKAWIVSRIHDFLGNKVNGLYRVIPAEPFEMQIKKLSAGSEVDELALSAILAGSGADYALLAELSNLKESGSMGMFRSAKNTRIGLDIKILDIINGRYLTNGRFTGKAIDDNAVISIGDRLVALFTIDSREITVTALDRLLFQVGEVISASLPLAPPGNHIMPRPPAQETRP